MKPLEQDVSTGQESLNPLCQLISRKRGVDLHPYKEKFLRRRVEVRLRATGSKSVAEYVGYLGEEEQEVDRFLLAFTIHVSTFFRNPSTFQAIEREVLPVLFRVSRAGSAHLWSVGCARGEEPYSLAILVSEYGRRHPLSRKVLIEAIDVDEKVLADAKRGEYSASQVRDLDPVLLQRYFEENGDYRLVPEIREMVKFHRRDVFMAPPRSGYDLILCRNLLIYIDREPQERVIERFHEALRPGGFLALGRTEALVGPLRERFETVDPKERIYRKVS